MPLSPMNDGGAPRPRAPRGITLRRARPRRAVARWPARLLAVGALVALGVLGLGGAGRSASPLPSPTSLASLGESSPVPSLAALGTPPGSPADSPVPPAQAPLGLPTGWLQNHRPAVLWSAAEADASAVRELPQWTPLRALGPSAGERLLVEEPGDGFARLPARGWVEASAVGPSGGPPVDWRLAVYPDLRGAPRWQGTRWPQGISAEFGAVVDGDSGQLLYGKDPFGRVAPASLTKIATAIVALERADLNDVVTSPINASEMPESTVMGLSRGERVSLRTLLYGLMLPSGNDAAVAIAHHVGGSEARFVELMNELAARLELRDTHFANPHGLDAPGHYSSPFDMAQLARYGMRNPHFAALAAAKVYEAEGYRLYNLNQLLWAYDAADGVKIGYTDLAGRAIVGSATRDGHRLFVALMRSPDHYGDAIGLLNYAFRSFRWD